MRLRKVTILYSSGKEREKFVPESSIEEFLRCFRNSARFDYLVGDIPHGIDMSVVDDFSFFEASIDTNPQDEDKTADRHLGVTPELVTAYAEALANVQVAATTDATEERIPELDKPKIKRAFPSSKPKLEDFGSGKYTFLIECKCGSEYLWRSDERSKYFTCIKCNQTLYADVSLGRFANGKDFVYLLTNRYHVDNKGINWRD